MAYINVSVISRFSHSKTENELSSYLVEKFLDHAMKTNLQVVGAWGCQCRATTKCEPSLKSSRRSRHQDVVTCSGRNCQWSFISILQTQMLIVPLRRYAELCVKTSFVFAMGDNHRLIGLSPMACALGSVELAELPASHADITGRFPVEEKLPCWKTFMDTEDTITALGSLGATVHPPRRDISPCGEVYKPALSAWNWYLTSQGTKMAYMYVQKQLRPIGLASTKQRVILWSDSPLPLSKW